jgi:CRISPR-associated protein Cas1
MWRDDPGRPVGEGGDPISALQFRRGSLCVRTRNGEQLLPARLHGIGTIILAGHGASFTADALRWIAREGIALYLMNLNGEAFSFPGAAVETDHRRKALNVRQRQFAAVFNRDKRLKIAKNIVFAKLHTLRLYPSDKREFWEELNGARRLSDVLTCEARAAGAYFMKFRGRELRFASTVPDQWRVFISRGIGGFVKGASGVSRARHAATPAGAMLNYGYGVALGQCTRAAIGAGLDPCFGFLHSPKPGRLSFAYDALELHRAAVTEGVFGYCRSSRFDQFSFAPNNRGVVRLGSSVARDVAALTLRRASMKACGETVKQIAGWF